MISPDGFPAAAFSHSLSESEMTALGAKHKKSIIFEAELLAMVLAMSVFKPYIAHCPLRVFIDNNSVRDVAISGKARCGAAIKMVEYLLRLEDTSAVWPWYSRVPSESNPSDLPSRQACEHVCINGREVRVTSVTDELEKLFAEMSLVEHASDINA